MTELSRISDTGKSEALRLADALELEARLTWLALPLEAAEELRRLHAENAELTRALEISGKANRALVAEVEAHVERMALWTASHERMSRRIAELEQAAWQAKETLEMAARRAERFAVEAECYEAIALLNKALKETP